MRAPSAASSARRGNATRRRTLAPRRARCSTTAVFPSARRTSTRATSPMATSGGSEWSARPRTSPWGTRRRPKVARALATEPKLLLLDEPTAGMNPQETQAFTAFVHKVRDERDLTVLLIEHDMRVVLGVSERVTVLDQGGHSPEGPPAEVTANERVREAYLGTRSSA